MKKFTFMLVAAFMAVMSYAQSAPAGADEVEQIVEPNALTEQNVYKFDFTQHDRDAVTTQESDAGDVQDGVIMQEGFITLENTNSAEVNNCYQLHANMTMFFAYAGSELKFSVPYGSHIDEIKLDFSQWGAGSSFDKGSYTNTGNGRQTWTPDAGDLVRDVTLSVGGVVTRLYSITVTVTSDRAVEPTQEVLDAAEDFNIDAIYYQYSSRYCSYTQSNWWPVHIQKTIQASYDEEGNIYLQGLAYYDESAWLKGSIDIENNTITIPAQKWYEDDYGITYFAGFDADTWSIAQDVVFDVVDNGDETKSLVLRDDVIAVENDSQKEEFSAWGFYGLITINENEYVHPEPLEAPEGLETAEFILDGAYYGYFPFRRSLQIGIDDEENVWIQGVSVYLPEAWVKGQVSNWEEIDGNQVATEITVPCNQYLGLYVDDYYGEEYDLYLSDNSWYLLGDLVFTIDPETKTITTANTITINQFYDIFESIEDAVVTPYIVPDVVEVPEGVEAYEYYYLKDDEDAGVRNVAVDADNNKIYIQGLFPTMPEAWIVGDIDNDNEQITVKANQFLGQAEDGTDMWLNFHGDDYVFDFTTDFTPDMVSAEQIDQIGWELDGFNTLKANQKLYDYLFDIEELLDEEDEIEEEMLLTRVATLVPDEPTINAVNAIMVGDGVVEIDFEIATTMTYEDALGAEQVVDIDENQISYEFFFEKDGEWQPLVFTKDLYADLAEDQSEFGYFEEYAGIELGKVIIKDNVVGEWTKIGLKTYNRVPYTNTWRESEMAEVVLKNIATGIQEIAADEAVSYTDMQGRQTTAAAKGLVIKQVRSNNGAVKTVKVVRK